MANPMFKLEDATRLQCKASIMIEGLSGKGKTGLALLIARGLASDWSKIVHTDTENKSARLFVGLPFSNGENVGTFKVGELTKDVGFKPTNFLQYRKLAKDIGAEVWIGDSISHAWQYSGGVLDMVSKVAAQSKNPNDKYAPWRNVEVVDEKNSLLELIRDPDIHVITTVRLKEKFDLERDDTGKSKIKSLGEQQIMQDDLKYEPDLVLRMVSPGSKDKHPVAEVIKTRYAIFTVGEEYEFTPELIKQLKVYLEEGADPTALLEEQRQEYIQATKDYLKAHPKAKVVLDLAKQDEGYDDKVKLSEIPLDKLKQIYIKLTSN